MRKLLIAGLTVLALGTLAAPAQAASAPVCHLNRYTGYSWCKGTLPHGSPFYGVKPWWGPKPPPQV